MSSILEEIKVQVKQAREYAYLSRYKESVDTYKHALTQINSYMKNIIDNALRNEWIRLQSELQQEQNVSQELYDLNRGVPTVHKVEKASNQSRNPPRRTNSDEGEDLNPDKKYPFGKKPFQGQLERQMSQNNQNYQQPPPQQYYQQRQQNYEQPQYQPPENIFQDNENPFRPNLNNNHPDKDPDVWGPPPSKPQQKKKPALQKKASSQNNSNQQNQKANNGKDYPKPWNQNAKTPNNKQGNKEDGEKEKDFLKHHYPDGVGPDTDLINRLERDMLDKNPNIQFNDIAELTVAKDILQEAVLLPILLPQYFIGIRRPWKGVLMFGPPGTGKTMLAKAVATTGKTTFFNVSASSIASKWRGDGEKLIRLLFEMARFYAPSTIFFDEIDSLGSKRGDNECEASRRIKSELLVQMDGVSENNSQSEQKTIVMVLAATNRPWDLDEALRRRLEKRILIPLPTEEGIMELFKINLKNVVVDETVDFTDLVTKCQGFSGADISNLCREAAMMPMRRQLKNQGGFGNIGNIQELEAQKDIPLTQSDFNEAIKNINKSVSSTDLQRFQDWMDEFGSK